jgi:hypothetical protein
VENDQCTRCAPGERKRGNAGADCDQTTDRRARPVTTLGGHAIFGNAVTVVHNPHPNAQQINQYFGIDGQQTLFGGTRGRAFVIECRSTIVIARWPCYSARETSALVQVAGTGRRGPFHSPMAIRK